MADLTGTILGGYKLTRPLYFDGLTDVYVAYQEKLKRNLAVRILPSDLAYDEHYLKAFPKGVLLAAQLQHPNIEIVYDYGVDQNMPFMVVSLLAGGSLDERLAQDQYPSFQETTTILKDIGGALDYIHRSGIVHRDVKPKKIRFDSMGNAYLIDIGIMNAFYELSRSEGTPMGTPHYMAPEVIEDKPSDTRADIYALGIVTYQLLTKKMPFDAETPMRLLMKHLNEMPPRPSEIETSLTRQVDAVLFKALAKDPNERYQTAGEFAAALEAALASITNVKHIFISYAKKDCFDLAHALHAELVKLPQVTAWFDASLESGEDWALQIQEEIDRCDFVVVLLSPDVNRPKSDPRGYSFVLREIHYAQENEKAIIPVMAQETKTPLQLSGIQYIDFKEKPLGSVPELVEKILERILRAR